MDEGRTIVKSMTSTTEVEPREVIGEPAEVIRGNFNSKWAS